MIALDDRFVQSERSAHRILDDLAVVMTPQDSMIHTLNAVATVIWNRVDGHRTVREICDLLEEEYDVPRPKLEKDIRDFFQILLDRKVIERI